MGAYFTISSIGYILILLIHFVLKTNFQNVETKTYRIMLFLTMAGLLLDATGYVLYSNGISVNSLIYHTISKAVLLYFAAWEMCFTYYTYIISSNKIIPYRSLIKHKIVLFIIFVFISCVVVSSKLSFKIDNGVIYPQGFGVSFSYIVVGLCYVLCVYFAIKNIKHIGTSKYIPLFTMLVFSALVPVVQSINPGLYLINYCISIIMIILYFTIENPDTKMLDEYRRNREYADATNREKAVFLFNITQDIRKPLNEIGEACNELSLMTNNKEINKGINYIDSTSRNLLGFVNGVLDISNLETCNIKVYNTKYNPTLILNELVKSAKETINKDVDFRVNIDKSIPELLYGDSMRIKQVIKTLLDNASKYTKEGYIELNVHEIRKESLCRLLITVEDSGSGIKADEYALIFDKTREDDEVHKIDDSKNNLAVAKTVAALLGGLLTFTTSIGEGTKFTFILDQKMVEDTSKEFKQIEKYTQAITKPTVIVVSEDEEYLSTAVKKISKYDLDVTGSNLGAKCIEKIRHNVKCDYILLDEDLLTLDIYEVLTKLKEIKDFHSKVYVLSRNTDNLKFIKNGFDKVISRKIKGSEISELEKDE